MPQASQFEPLQREKVRGRIPILFQRQGEKMAKPKKRKKKNPLAKLFGVAE